LFHEQEDDGKALPEETHEVWNMVIMMYAPIFFSVPFS
jgi:hypothetical protein